MTVHRVLGCGYFEGVYENALAIELKRKGIHFQRQVEFLVWYRKDVVGTYIADLVVENKLLLELKALNSLNRACESQLLNYLKASKIRVGLLINFGSTSLQIKRMTIAQQQHLARKKSV